MFRALLCNKTVVAYGPAPADAVQVVARAVGVPVVANPVQALRRDVDVVACRALVQGESHVVVALAEP